MKLILFTDGAARGNPGPAAIGIVLTDPSGKEIEALGEAIGNTTNNEAEYRALLHGLEIAGKYSNEIEIRTDSELMARQLNGAYRVRAEHLKPLHDQTQRAMAKFKIAKIAIIPRELNKRADELANQALDQEHKTGNGNLQLKDNSPVNRVADRTKESPPLVIIVSGPPCSGKTTLARQIAEQFQLPLIAKDDIKESLFDSLGWQNREWSKKLGRATFDLLFYFLQAQLEAERSLVIEANFDADTMSGQFRALQAKHNFVPFQILCRADSAILTQRFRERWESGSRHRGHVDDEIDAQELDTILKRSIAPLDIGGTVIKIDTTDLDKVDYTGLLAKIAIAMKSSPSEV